MHSVTSICISLFQVHVYFFFLQTGVREVVAIKCVLKSSLNKASTENLLTEIELLKNLKHEHIVTLKDFQVRNGTKLFQYKMTHGCTLTQQ